MRKQAAMVRSLLRALEFQGVREPISEPVEMYAALGRAAGWTEEHASLALEVINSLWHGDLRGFARASLLLRERLDDQNLDSDAALVILGLLTSKAEAVLAQAHRVDPEAFRRLVRRQARRARRQGWLLSVYLGEQAEG